MRLRRFALGATAVPVAQCMREHGVQMEDPKPGEPMRVRIPEGNREELEEAHKACQKYIQPPQGRDPDDPKMRDAMLRFAQCMREHGIDMPDPKPGEGIRLTKEQVESPEFRTPRKPAKSICRARGPRAVQ